jgi:hypothetical protein
MYISSYSENKEETLRAILPEGPEHGEKREGPEFWDLKENLDTTHTGGGDYSITGEDYSLSETARKRPEQQDHPDGWRDYKLPGMDYSIGSPEIM